MVLLAHWDELFIYAAQMLRVCPGVCLGVNQGSANRNRYTQRIVILHVQT